ncbi:Uncharacterised protein [Mycobacterium tuberculosis]|uniref:Uncharacterized protein n=1 Tax=Mycobacterium tuberculosis TaxID=1773 RepID=A0A916PGQ6_MYCTX|nr:Uncharacterised protein [Mycobacterium tuberculosis]COY58996.1 Uncharacterised protein [Mycobacterium tuberculosis]
MKGRPPANTPTCKTVTMCGCPERRPMARCSRRKRSRLSRSRSVLNTLTATARSSEGWTQR